MKTMHAGLFGALLLAPAVSMAGPYGQHRDRYYDDGDRGRGSGGGFVDLAFVANDTDRFTIDDPTLGHIVDEGKGDGFGIRGLARASNGFALEGEFRSVSHDFSGTNEDVDYSRIGAGFANRGNSGLFVEWSKLKYSDDSGGGLSMDGWAAHGRLAGYIAPQVQIYGEAGYADMKDDDDIHWKGPDFVAGMSFELVENVALFANYRLMLLKAHDGTTSAEDRFDGVDLGVKFSFGR